MTSPKPRNGVGTAGFVCGFVGFAGGLIPVVGLFTWSVAIAGMGLCTVGRGRVGRGIASNYGLCVAGMILGIAGILFSLGTACIAMER